MLYLSKKESAIFLFHRVLPERDYMWDPTDPVLFEQSLRFIKKNFFVTGLNEVIGNPGATSSKPLAAITFDDGYRDFIDYSLPLLDKYALPSSMFVVTDCIDKNTPTWTYVMDYLFNNTGKMRLIDFDTSTLPVFFQQIIWADKAGRVEYGKKIKQYIKKVDAVLRNYIIDVVIENFNDVDLPSGMMMNWQDIINIAGAGVQIGSHSVSHTTLATIKTDEEVLFELKESALRIKNKTGIDSTIFSYPIGSYDNRIKELTRKAGYSAALAVDQKPYNAALQDVFSIPRIELYNESWFKTKARLNGSLSLVKKILHK